MTDWKWRLLLFVPAAAGTAENRTAFAEAFVDNGSGETLEDERKMFDSVARLSVSGNEPVQAFAISTLVKASMRDALKTLIDGIPNAEWYVLANGGLPSWNGGELIQSSRSSVDGLIGTQFEFADALNDLNVQRIV